MPFLRLGFLSSKQALLSTVLCNRGLKASNCAGVRLLARSKRPNLDNGFDYHSKHLQVSKLLLCVSMHGLDYTWRRHCGNLAFYVDLIFLSIILLCLPAIDMINRPELGVVTVCDMMIPHNEFSTWLPTPTRSSHVLSPWSLVWFLHIICSSALAKSWINAKIWCHVSLLQ